MNQTSTYSYLTLALEQQIQKLIERMPEKDENRTFENYYILGKLINEYPSTVRKSINKKLSKPNVEDKLVRLAKWTAILFDIVGLSYLSLRKLTPHTLWDLSNEKFKELTMGAREIIAERLTPPDLLEVLLGAQC
ncbi:7525_t:CDS:2 [Entrophospora sp. SA101]|nr:7525_t:CDS:2 [Entrophospora sp. SA101]